MQQKSELFWGRVNFREMSGIAYVKCFKQAFYVNAVEEVRRGKWEREAKNIGVLKGVNRELTRMDAKVVQQQRQRQSKNWESGKLKTEMGRANQLKIKKVKLKRRGRKAANHRDTEAQRTKKKLKTEKLKAEIKKEGGDA